MSRVTERKPINHTGLVNPQAIELQELNVIEISLGRAMGMPYVIVSKKDDTELGLMNPASGVPLRKFPPGTTIYELSSMLKLGHIIAWYSTVGDYVRHRNRIIIPVGGDAVGYESKG